MFCHVTSTHPSLSSLAFTTLPSFYSLGVILEFCSTHEAFWCMPELAYLEPSSSWGLQSQVCCLIHPGSPPACTSRLRHCTLHPAPCALYSSVCAHLRPISACIYLSVSACGSSLARTYACPPTYVLCPAHLRAPSRPLACLSVPSAGTFRPVFTRPHVACLPVCTPRLPVLLCPAPAFPSP